MAFNGPVTLTSGPTKYQNNAISGSIQRPKKPTKEEKTGREKDRRIQAVK
jgi:hypothetical protein